MDICYKNIKRDTVMRYVAFFVCLMVTAGTRAGVYKWIDDDGNVHYGDTLEATLPGVEMDIGDNLLSREEKRERLLQSMAEDRLEKQEQREKQKALKQENRAKCNRYRDRMRHYQRANALYTLDKEGKRVYVSDSERAQATQKLQRKIKKYCN